MAENKKSFVLYADLLQNIDHLTLKEKGILFTHLLEYVNDMRPILKDRLILTAWKPIERQLKRDLVKFEQVKVKRSDAGKESARIRALNKDKESLTNPTRVKSVEQDSTNPTVSVNDNVNVILIKSVLTPPDGVDALYFYLAKGYHKMFYDYKGSKSLENAQLESWVNIIRLLIEVDKVTVPQLIAVKLFLQAGINKDRGVDSFWSDTIYSINALRKKSKDGVYSFDRIKLAAKNWLNKNPEQEAFVYQSEKNLMDRVNG